ncbi:SDR family NAD(P)-dependent oxidoreductase [Streptomyces sp. NPDC126933]|uniref:SDR family NAD(P)-dependent oxidoreductase n=1 Tax=unclassified Streptomyces TaxID=2593676 RepID=UPI00365FA559
MGRTVGLRWALLRLVSRGVRVIGEHLMDNVSCDGCHDRVRVPVVTQFVERDRQRPLPIDVTSDESVRTAVELVREEAGLLDVLVNNAGIVTNEAGVADGSKPISEVTAADLETIYATNVFGIVRVTHAFLPLLSAADHPVVVNVSSGLGSLARVTDPQRFEAARFPAYGSSKSAVNMLTVQYAEALPEFKINAADPGYTATDLNDHRGTKTVQEGADIIVRLATIGADGPTGGYFAADGPVPW